MPASSPRSAVAADWRAFYRATTVAPPHHTTAEAIARFTARPSGNQAPPGPRLALDLGCGAGRDTRALLQSGFAVVAVDVAPGPIRAFASTLSGETRARLRIVSARFEEFAPRTSFELVNASLAVSFCRPEAFPSFIRRILAAIEPGGRFAGHFLGRRDAWADARDQTFLERGDVERLFAHFDLELFRETEVDDVDALGRPKHWHLFGVVARRRLEGDMA